MFGGALCASPAKFQRTGAVYDLIKGSDAILVQSRVFNSADFHFGARMSSSNAGQDALQGTTHHTDYLAGSLVLSCVLGARTPEVTEYGNTSY